MGISGFLKLLEQLYINYNDDYTEYVNKDLLENYKDYFKNKINKHNNKNIKKKII